MCGIYITNLPLNKKDVFKRIDKIKFRGPDYTGISKINEILLGHLRLSILDIEQRSNQPMSFSGHHIVYNGEIYNYIQIQKQLESLGHTFVTSSDTEVLLKAFIEWGKDALTKINGMFAFAIYDEARNSIFCARDRLGVKPLYYYWKNGKFEICSQLKPLITSDRSISETALSIYIDSGFIPSPYSILEDVYKLQPGSYLEINLSSGSYKIEKYWDLSLVENANVEYEEAKEKLHELLKNAVKIRLKSDVPLGFFLSGGIDSSLVSSIASSLLDKPINTFSIAFDDPKYDESKFARQYAKIINSNHTEIVCRSNDVLKMLPKFIEVYDEPFADSSALPSLLLCSITKNYVTVALSGDGGDESFLGYKYFQLIEKFNKISSVPYFLRNAISKLPLYKFNNSRPETIKEILNCKSSDDLAVKIFTSFTSLPKRRSLKWLENYKLFKELADNSLQRAADLNIKLWLENDSNVKVDRASMAYSLEVRSPFLDYRVIEFARTLPINYRYQLGRQKRILRDILNEYIPEKIFNKPKKGFSIPMGKWIRKELKDEITGSLNQNFLKCIPNLDVPKFNKLLDYHMTGKYDYSFDIWKLFVLAKWYEKFY